MSEPETKSPDEEVDVEQTLTDLDAEVAQAQRDAADAEALVSALEEQISAGAEGVSAEDYESRRSLSRFAQLRVKALRQKIADAKAEKHRRECEAVRAQIEEHAATTAPRLAGLLADAEQAVSAFLLAAGEREELLHGWRANLHRLGVPDHKYPVAPPTEHGQLGTSDGGVVIAGARRMRSLDVGMWTSRMLGQAIAAAGLTSVSLIQPGGSTLRLGGDLREELPYQELAEADDPQPEPTESHFYKGENGQVIARDRPFTVEELSGMRVTRVSREEAWGAA